MLPLDFDVTEKRTHDYVRHGVTNLFAALDVGAGRHTCRSALVRSRIGA